MNLIELITPAAIAAYFDEVYSNKIDYLGAGLFPAEKRMGLDLAWFKDVLGLPISLKPSAFDAKATFRDRIGVDKIVTEMPFFREGFKVKERDRQEVLRLVGANDPYLPEVINRIFRDGAELIAGADVVPERMRMQLLFPIDGDLGIHIAANGVNYVYNYDGAGTWKSNNYFVLTSTDKWDAPSTADPVKTFQTVRNAIRGRTGAEPTVAIMNQATFDAMSACASIVKRFDPVAVYITDAEASAVLSRSLNITPVVYDKMYKDESGTAHKFVPDGYVSFVPAGALGKTVYGTTPEEADLMGSGQADVQIVNTGVALTRETTVNPVNVNTFASEIVLPTFETMDSVACIKVF